MRVLFLIEEGRRSRIATVDFEGVSAVPHGALRRALYSRRGRPFNPAYLVADTAIIARQEGEHGHLPRVVGTARRDERDSLQVHVVYRVAEGPLYHVGGIRVGDPEALRVSEKLVRRELLLKPGSVYRFSRVEESEERLYQTGLFSEVQVTPQPDSTNTLMDFLVRVRARKLRWLDAGVGSGTQERLRFEGEWGHRNLGQHGLQGLIGARLALDQNADFRNFLLLRGEAAVLEPWLLGTRNRAQVTLYAEKRKDFRIDTLEIDKKARGVTFQVQRDFGRLTYLRLTQDNTWVVRQDLLFSDRTALPPAVQDSIRKSVLPSYSTHRLQLSGVRDHRDSPLTTTRGNLQAASAELAGGPFKGSTSFTKFEVSSSWFTPLRRPGLAAGDARARRAGEALRRAQGLHPVGRSGPRGRAGPDRGPVPSGRRELGPRLRRERDRPDRGTRPAERQPGAARAGRGALRARAVRGCGERLGASRVHPGGGLHAAPRPRAARTAATSATSTAWAAGSTWLSPRCGWT